MFICLPVTPRVVLTLAISASLLLAHAGGPQSVAAQTMADESHQMVEVPAGQLTEIQQELEYLRARDAQRQIWDYSLADRLPASDFDYINLDYLSSEEGSPHSETYEYCQQSSYLGKSYDCRCKCCRCDPCQCPTPEAPCLDCPRVSTLSPYNNIHVFGAVKLDMLFNSARPISPGTPYFVTPGSLTGLDQRTFDIHARQTTLGAAFNGPQIGRFQSGGLLLAMLYNDAVVVDQYGFLPLQAWGELKNNNWRFAGGQQFDVFAPGTPTVLPFSALCASGNTGNSFRGQLRLERYLHQANNVQWTLQGALSEPISSTIDPRFRLSEDNGWPNVEGRIALGLGCVEGAGLDAKRPFEFGVSGVVGQIRTTLPPPDDRVVADVWGVAVDFRWKMSQCCGFMGEVYTGQTLGTYSGGILQSVSADTLEGIRSSGGWLEVFYYWTPCVHSHVGYAIDDPRNRDVAASAAALGRTKNSTYFGNLIWDVNKSFRVAFELTWRETDYKAPTLPDNESVGFHTQFQWSF